MALSYPLDMPATAPKSIKLGPVNLATEFRGYFDGISQITDRGAEWWEGSLTWGPMKRDKAEVVLAWATALRGIVGSFLLPAYACKKPRGTATSGSVSGSAGDRIVTLNLNGALLTGDYFSLTDGGLPRLHKVLEDTSGGLVNIFPSLRTTLTAEIAVLNPVGAFRLAENKRTWAIDEARIFGIALNIREALETLS